MSAYAIGVLSMIGINSILALSVYVILATGQLALGNAGFMAIGAYLSSFLTVQLQIPFAISLMISAVVALIIGVLVGIPALRFRGIYLAMATLAFGEIVRTFFLNYEGTGAAQGYSGMEGVSVLEIWIWVALLFALVFVFQRSTTWLKFRAVEGDDFASEITGLNTTWIKTSAFGMGAVIAAIGGGLFAQYSFYIEPNNFGWSHSVDMVLFVIIGGSTVLWGPLAGAAILTWLPEILRPIAEWRLAVYGALLVVILLFRPQGLLAPFKRSVSFKESPLGKILSQQFARPEKGNSR